MVNKNPQSNPSICNEQLLAHWADGTLDAHLQREFEQRCIDDAQFAAAVEAHNQIQAIADDYPDFTLPVWDKDATFDGATAAQSQAWWQSPWTALGGWVCTFAAFGLVFMQPNMTGAELDAMVAEQVTQQVNAQMLSYQQSQQNALLEYAQELQAQQQDSQQQLTQYLLASSRAERKEDFNELLRFIAEQRAADQAFYARQFSTLEDDIYALAELPLAAKSATKPSSQE